MHHSGKNDRPTESSSHDNSSHKSQERILKNTSYLTVAFILQKVLSFGYFIYIARIIGPVDFGLYDPAKSLIPILLILIDFSLSVVLVREIARKPEKTEDFLANVLSLKTIFAFVIILGMGIFTNFSSFGENQQLIKTVLYLDALIVALDTFTLTFFAVFRGRQNMKFESIGIVGTQILTILFGVAALIFNWGLQALFVAVVIGSVFNFIFSYVMLRKKLRIRVRLGWNIPIIKTFLKTALPFAITAVFVKIYTYTDRYMLLLIEGRAAAGWYAVSHKLTYAIEFIPSAFAVSIFPAMSAFYISSRDKLAKTFERSMHYLTITAIPISIGIFILAEQLIIKISGEAYATSITPWRILIIGLVVLFLNFPVGAFLNACNKQIINTINMGITVVVNVSLNIYFIAVRGFSFNGAATAALISGFVLFFLGLRWVGKINPYNGKMLVRIFIKAIVAGAIMGVLLFLVRDSVSIFISIPGSAIVYFAALYGFKGIAKKDIKMLYNALVKRFI